MTLRLALGALALTISLWAGGNAAAASAGELEPGCVAGSDGFIIRLCLATPPPFGDRPASAPAVPDPAGTVFLETVRTSAADLRVELRIGQSDRVALGAAVERDVPAVEREYGQPFDRRPLIQVFASVGSFEQAVQILFGYPAAIARSLSSSGGAMDRPSGSIVINWQRVANERPVAILRHELSHLMVRQIVGVDASVPAWFDEGLATLSQYALGAQATAQLKDDYVASALVSTRSLSLAQLVTTESWLRSTTTDGTGAYAVAGAAAATIRGDVGQQGVVRILELTGSGRTFEDAFAEVTRRSVASFSSAVGDRIGERAVPEIALSAGTDARGNVTFTVRGFPPAQPIELAIDGTATSGQPYHLVYALAADVTGTARGTFGSTAPAGTYAIRARSGAISATTVLRTYGAR